MDGADAVMARGKEKLLFWPQTWRNERANVTMLDAWASIPSSLLHAELQRRRDQGERPQCGGHNSGWYDTAAHVFALLLILVLSTIGKAVHKMVR